MTSKTVSAARYADNTNTKINDRDGMAQKYYNEATRYKAGYQQAMEKSDKFWAQYRESLNRDKPETKYRDAARLWDEKEKLLRSLYRDAWKKHQEYAK